MGATASINPDSHHNGPGHPGIHDALDPNDPFIFSLLGLKWSHWAEFVDHCGGKSALKGLTVKQLYERFLQKVIDHYQCSYCELLRRNGHEGVGKANIYVSYSWDMDFLTVMESIECYIHSKKQEEEEQSHRGGTDTESDTAAGGDTNSSSLMKKRTFSFRKPEEIVLWMDIFSFNFIDSFISGSSADNNGKVVEGVLAGSEPTADAVLATTFACDTVDHTDPSSRLIVDAAPPSPGAITAIAVEAVADSDDPTLAIAKDGAIAVDSAEGMRVSRALQEEEDKLMWDTKFKYTLEQFELILTVFVAPPWHCRGPSLTRALNEKKEKEKATAKRPPTPPAMPPLSPRAVATLQHHKSTQSGHLPVALQQLSEYDLVLPPSPLTRTWCLYEIYCAMIDNLPFDLAMTDAVKAQCLADLVGAVGGAIGTPLQPTQCCSVRGGYVDECIDHLTSTIIDFVHTQSTHVTCHKRLCDVVKMKIGITTFNTMIYEQIRFWMVDLLTTALKQSGGAHHKLTDNMSSDSKRVELAKLPYQLALGHVYRIQGAYETAEALYTHCLEMYRELLSPTPTNGANDSDDIAVHLRDERYLCVLYSIAILREAIQDYELAESMYRDVLRIRMDRSQALPEGERDGDNDEGIVAVKASLGNLFRTIGDYERAELYLVQVLEMRKNALDVLPKNVNSPDSPTSSPQKGSGSATESERVRPVVLTPTQQSLLRRYFVASTDLFLFYKEIKRHTLAEILAIEHYQLRVTYEGIDSSDTMSALNQLGNLYYDMNLYDKAEFYYQLCIQRRRDVLGESHLLTLTSMTNLANLYLALGMTQTGLMATIGTGDDGESKGGEGKEENHEKTEKEREEQGRLYRDYAETLYMEVYETRRAVYGDSQADTLTALFNLASYYDDCSSLILRWILELQHDNEGESKTSGDGENNEEKLSLLRHEYRSYKLKTEEMYLEVLEKRKIVLGFTHNETLSIMQTLGLFYRGQGEWEMAISLLSNVYECYESIYGEDHPETLLAMYNVAILHEEMKEYNKAEKYFLRCFEYYARRLGIRHNDTMGAIRHLMTIYRDWQEDIELKDKEGKGGNYGNNHSDNEEKQDGFTIEDIKNKMQRLKDKMDMLTTNEDIEAENNAAAGEPEESKA